MRKGVLALGISMSFLAGCANMDMGSQSAKTEATGSAGGANSQGANKQLTHCSAPLGTIAVVEDTNTPWYETLTGQYHLGATTPVIKLMIQQSNCFVVVDRGQAMNNMMGERQLAQSGELRNGSHFGKGQMVSADYSLAPSITFSNNNAGGAGAALGGLFGSAIGMVAGSITAKEASVLLTVDDNRSGVQLVAAEGSAKNWDIGGMGGLFGGGLGGIGGGYSNTAEGKVIVAAFMDAYNNVVKAVQNYSAQNVKGGLGTGGGLQVQGANDPNQNQSMSIAQAQEKLNTLGFNVGTPDGKIGPHTRLEIKKFQKSKGISVTGRLDSATIGALSNSN